MRLTYWCGYWCGCWCGYWCDHLPLQLPDNQYQVRWVSPTFAISLKRAYTHAKCKGEINVLIILLFTEFFVFLHA